MSTDTVFGTLTRPDGLERVLVVRRTDGLATYRRQWADPASGQWASPGPDCGLYDTVEMAEAEARSKVWWLAA
jgi:hypothetical protein